jgi:putative membrane-bound dehydrogenase-like protein
MGATFRMKYLLTAGFILSLPFARCPAADEEPAAIPKPDDAPKPMTPEESARAFQLPDGFRMEVVASEPLIASPSAVCWDERGRMFVSELHGYNLEGQLDIEELNKTGKLDTQVRRVQADEKFVRAAKPGTFGVVKLLTDADADGRMDKSVVWARDLPPAYGLVAARGGVIVACAPDIVYLADRDGDGMPEVREKLFTGFHTGALERGINAPLWNVDGWIYVGRGHGGGTITGPHLPAPVNLPDSDFRIRADGTAIEPVTGATHTLGFAFTEAGERFICTTSIAGIFIAPLPAHYLARNPDAATPSLSLPTGERHAYQISQPHPWRQKRADDAAYAKFYRDRYGAAESDAGGWFTAACGALVYQDSALPGLHGQYLVCEPSGNIIHRAVIEADGSALKLTRVPGEERSEFAASRDGWSHPIRLQHGPDGSIWVVDYYREIIEDYSAIPRHLQQQYGLYAGHDRGRIYRLTHCDAPTAPSANMAALSAEALAREIASLLFWRRETAQRLIVERKETTAVPVLRGFVADAAARTSTLIAALHTLDQLEALRPADVIPMLTDRDPAVRIHALKLGDQWLAKEEARALLDAVLNAAAGEREPRVALQFALSLGESRDPRALAMLVRYARERLDIRWMDAALLSSLHGRAIAMLTELLREPAASAPFLDKLAAAIAASRDDAELARALTAIRTATPDRQAALLTSLAKGRANAKRQPLADAAASRELAALAASMSPEVRRAARSLEESFMPQPATASVAGLPEAAPPVDEATFRRYVASLAAPRDAKRGHMVFLQSCAVCHRVGEEGINVGPELMAEVGVAEETLLRHLLMPSERIRPGFETTLVETSAGTTLAGLLHEDGATSLTLRLPGGAEQVILRKDVLGVRRAAVSLMPAITATLQPADAANLLAWLRANLKPPPPGRAVLFDDDPDFAALLNEGDGSAEVVAAKPFSGALCLSITPPQRYSPRIPKWNFRIVEKPSAPDEFRYLLLAWRTTGDGAMIELAASGQWPKPEDARRRYFAGKNTTPWQARQTHALAPAEWREEILDLWTDCGAFTLTGIAPTAMGGTAFFDRFELIQEKSEPAPRVGHPGEKSR